MNVTRTLLIRSFVKPFYRQHAGLFVFLFTIMFGVVNILHGAKFADYHFFLIKGMLKNPFLLVLVLFVWFLYIKKSEQFAVNILRRSDFSFLYMMALMESRKVYWLLVWIQFLIILPIIIYAVLIFVAGSYLHEYVKCGIILFYIISLCLICARWYLFIIQNPGRSAPVMNGNFSAGARESGYWSLFIRYIGIDKKLLFSGIKIYSCCILYLMLINQTRVDNDLRMIILFFSLGILGHGLLIHQLRNLEETGLTFYRTLPLPRLKRFMQYGMLYFVLLLPEIITIACLTPGYLHYKDAALFILLSFSLLMFMNSLLFIHFFRMIDYLKIILCIFLIVYFCVLSASLPLLCILLLISSLSIFYIRYYQFER
jgi:hypothetical protein